MKDPQDKHAEEHFADILDGFSRIAGRIDQKHFPGAAWPIDRLRRRNMVGCAAVAATVAAITLVFAIALWPQPDSRRGGGATTASSPASGPRSAGPAPEDAKASSDANVSPDVTPAATVAPALARASWQLPSISPPSAAESDFRWEIPTVSLPSSVNFERSSDES